MEEMETLLRRFNRLARGGADDKTLTARRERYKELRRTYEHVWKRLYADAPLERGKPKPRPDTLHRQLIDEKGWVDVSHEPEVIGLLVKLDSRSVLRKWRGRWDYTRNRAGVLACAPKWAATVARHAPERLREVFAYKDAKRRAITFQLEAAVAAKVNR